MAALLSGIVAGQRTNGKPPPSLSESESAELDQSFRRWWREYERGSLTEEDPERTRERPLLHPALRARRSAYAAPYNRRAESLELVALLAQRSKLDDAKHLIQILRHDWPKHREVETLRGLRAAILDGLLQSRCSVTIQGAVLDAIRSGEEAVDAPGEPLTLKHREPEFAARLLPLLATFHKTRFRSLLLAYCRSGQPQVTARAAEALAKIDARGTLLAIARAIRRLPAAAPDHSNAALYSDWRRLVLAARTVLRTHRAAQGPNLPKKPMVRSVALPGTTALVTAALHRSTTEDWLTTTEILVPLLLEFRQARSVPVLIDALERGQQLSQRPRYPTRLPFQLATIHEALQDLTGFMAPADAPDRWRAFWNEVEQGFVVPPPKPTVSTKTSAGFYGIPIRGRRVVFILDRSGSMASPIHVGRRETRASPRMVQRIEQAKTELLQAVARLPQNAKFRVLVFGDSVFSAAQMTSGTRALENLRSRLTRIRPKGGTQLLAALRQGIRGAIHAFSGGSRPSVDEVFVLSDGAPARSPSEILRAVREWNPHGAARIHTVFLGGVPGVGAVDARGENSPAAFMRRLAEENGGQFRQVR